MISDYLSAAMSRAHYEIIDNPEPYYGEIPDCKGVWATGQTLEECRANLQGALEGWVVLSLQRGLPIPVVNGIDLQAPAFAPANG